MAKLKKDFRSFDYNDVSLLPKKCIVDSRSQVDVSTVINGKNFQLPIVPANMSTIVDKKFAEFLAKNGYFYIMHRFSVDPVKFTTDFQNKGLISSVSLGIKKADYVLVDEFVHLGITPEFITIDVAHGHSENVIKMVEHVKKRLPNSFVIAGNVGTVSGAKDLENAGADGIKVGIGPGAVCLTSPNTGFGTRGWQLSAVQEVSDSVSEALIIADGGIREYGDIAKSIAFGADLVMIGGMLAGHDENPGELVLGDDGKEHKIFYGSASEHQKGEKRHVEGKRTLIPYKGSINDTLQTIKENLQSSVSYAGGNKLKDLYNTEFVFI